MIVKVQKVIKNKKQKGKYKEKEDNEEKDKLLKKRKLCGIIEGCDTIENYEHLNKIHEGVYGIVFRARDKITGEVFAIKKVKMQKELKEGFPITTIREINLLLGLKHRNIVSIKEMLSGNSVDKVYVVMEYMEHEVKHLLDSNVQHRFSWAQVKCLL